MTGNRRRAVIAKVSKDLEGLELGDPRRDDRALSASIAIAVRPSASFPVLFRRDADLEGFYRLLRNEQVGWRDLLEPHLESTVGRARELGVVLAVHDTTTVSFK